MFNKDILTSIVQFWDWGGLGGGGNNAILFYLIVLMAYVQLNVCIYHTQHDTKHQEQNL